MILGLDVGGSNVKASLVDDNLLIAGEKQMSTFMGQKHIEEILLALRQWLVESGCKKLEAIAVTRSPALRGETYLEGEIYFDTVIGSTFKDFLSENRRVLHLSRDGNFYPIGGVIEDVNRDYLNIIKYIDSNWLPLTVLVRERVRMSQFICVNFGTSSTSITPVKDGWPTVELHENRLATSKLVLIGLLYTPLIGFIRHVKFRGANVPINPYNFPLMADLALLVGAIKQPPEPLNFGGDPVYRARSRISGMVGGDSKLLTEAEIHNLCAQAIDQLRHIILSALSTGLKESKRQGEKICVAGINNKFFADLVQGSYKVIDTGLGNAATASAVALMYAKSS
jgi:uncharacterized hydantoinase/oxoprolinase family protein